MISKIIAWIIELFRSKPKKQKELEQKKEKLEQKLEEIENEDRDINDIIDELNNK